MLLYQWLSEMTRERGSARALVYHDTYYSWRGLLDRVDRRAQEFAAMGVGAGHWVGIMLGNVPEFVILALALAKRGATLVPLDPTTGPRDLQLMMEYAPLRALITRPRGGPEADPPEAKRGQPIESRRRLSGTLLTCLTYKPQFAPPAADCVLFTNDALGEPKGVLRSGENLDHAGMNGVRAFSITADDKILATVPLFHAYGFDLGLLATLRSGATLILEEEVAPKRVVKSLREQEIGVLLGTPQLYAGLGKLPTAKPLTYKNARYLSGGSELPGEIAEDFRARWGKRVIPLLHATESGLLACDLAAQTAGTVGKAVDGVELRIGDGKRGAGEAGPLWVRGAACAQKVVGPSARRSARGGDVLVGGFDGDGWLRSGDTGHLDKAGRLFLGPREDHLVKVDGKRVALGEVESWLEQFPKIAAARVRLVADPMAGPLMVASVVVDRGKVGAEELIEHCAKHLSSYKVPRRIEFCDTLPA